MEKFELLQAFRSLFDGCCYKHRNSTLGDFVASHLYEDLAALGKSNALTRRIQGSECGVNAGNKTVGKEARRGDGTFGELIPGVLVLTKEGLLVPRGELANLQIGAETKILAKAMIKQIDRVIGDLTRQVEEFRKRGRAAITIAFVGINHAAQYTSYESERTWITDGKAHKHPIQEAAGARQRIVAGAQHAFDELLFLPFQAPNVHPFRFAWVDEDVTTKEYAALLVRVSRLYDERFG